MPTTIAMPEDLLSAVDAGKILGLSADMVRLLAREGRLPAAAQTTRGVRLFRRSEVEQLASERAGLVHRHHEVQFYESEEFLSGFVGRFVAEALRARAPVVVIARESHRQAVCQHNRALGVDVEHACGSGHLNLYDAAETLATFMVGGMPDPALFRDRIGEIVRNATASRPRVRLRIYGEMVDVLWADGQREAAVQLEEMWNELAQQHSFSLLCAYDMSNFGGAGQDVQFDAICRAHTQVAPAESFSAGEAAVERHRQVARLQQRSLALQQEVERGRRQEGTTAAMHELLGMLGRELRGPLATIQTSIDDMRSGGLSADRQRTLELDIGAALRAVDEMVDYARTASGDVLIRRRPVELSGLVARAAAATAPPVVERLEVRVPNGLAIDADPDHMTRALTCLFSSAARSGGAGSPIAVEAARAGGSVRIAVRHRGVPLEPPDRIFHPLAPPRARAGEASLGFGLAIARDLVRLQGGTLTAHSAAGASELVVTIQEAPAIAGAHGEQDGNAGSAPSRTRRGPGASGARRILIVDDNEDLASLMSELLQDFGHQVETAHDGHSALQLAARFEPEVALLDIGLPGMDGYELARELRGQSRGNIRLIAITGYAQEADRDRSHEAGFCGHLVKPIDPATLARLIDEG